MASFFKDLKKSFTISSVLSLAMGILLLIYPDFTNKAICYAIGGILIVRGIFSAVRYFTNKDDVSLFRFDLIWGIILCAMGAFVLLRSDIIISIIPIVFGLFLIVSGFLTLQKAFNLKQMNYSKWTTSLILALIKAVLGVIMLINPFSTALTLTRFIGVGLVYDGLSGFWTIFDLMSASRHVKNAVESMEAIDVESKPADAEPEAEIPTVEAEIVDDKEEK